MWTLKVLLISSFAAFTSGFVCTKDGTFADKSDDTCRSYYMCITAPDHLLHKRHHTCPAGKIFDPQTSSCSSTAVCNPPFHYTCINPGFYADPASIDCRGYIMCSKLADGSITGIRYSCSEPKLFNPSTKQCTSYVCPKRFICTEVGKFPDPAVADCKGYVACIGIPGGSVDLLGQYVCPDGSRFDPVTQACSTVYTCKPNCVKDGAFPDPNVSDCKSYILCNTIADGTVKYIGTYTCPENQYFNPKTGLCSSSHVCDPKPRVCTKLGIFSDPTVPACKGYVTCSRLGNGTYFISHRDQCPGTSLYNRQTKLCDESYQCLDSPCAGEGRYPDDDEECGGYIVCMKSPDVNIGMQKFLYKCPAESAFNLATKKCEKGFDCNPGIKPYVCTAKGIFADPTSECRSYIICVKEQGTFDSYMFPCSDNMLFDPYTKTCSSTYVCGVKPERPTCVADGNLADFSMNDCKHFIVCVDNMGDIVDHGTFTCGDSANFNPQTRQCDPKYTCAIAAKGAMSYSVLDPKLYDPKYDSLMRFLEEFDFE